VGRDQASIFIFQGGNNWGVPLRKSLGELSRRKDCGKSPGLNIYFHFPKHFRLGKQKDILLATFSKGD
jgi:hypothetical protein